MNDTPRMLHRQAAWQRSRRLLPWPVKIRMAEMAREAIKQLRDDGARHKPHKDDARDRAGLGGGAS
jgi:hypothetical protein